MTNDVHITDKKHVLQFMLLCWFIYFAAYMTNYSLTASMGMLNAQGVFTKTQLGSFASALFLGYALSQPLLGFAGDYIAPKRMLMLGLCIAGVVNVLFSVCTSPAAAMVLWLLNGVAQAMFWPPFVRLSAMRLEQKQASKLCVLLCTCGPAGMLVSYVLAAMLGQRSSRLIFLIAAAAAMGMLAAILTSRRLLDCEQSRPRAKSVCEDGKAEPFFKTIWATGLIGFLFGSFLNGMLKDGVMTWLPIYLTDNQGITAQLATLLASTLPVINLLGVFLAHRAQKGRLRDEASTAAVCFLITLMSMVVITVFRDLGAAVSVTVLCVASSAMVGANTMLAGVAPIRFMRYGHVSSMTGLLNAAVHMGSSVSGALYGFLSETRGWDSVRMLWCALALLGMAGCLTARKRWRKCFLQTED